MGRQIDIKQFCELNYNGTLANDFCPKCGADVFQGKGKRWCNNPECNWSSDPDLHEFFKRKLRGE